jgi:NhaP-type Na+/H+ or K+/H+ antiporter
MVSYETFITIDYTHITHKDVFIIIGKFLLSLSVSSIFGFIFGYLTSLFIKLIAKYTKENLSLYESSVLIAVPWICYLVGSVIGLSGILIFFFNGISQAIYSKPFVLKETKHVRIFPKRN